VVGIQAGEEGLEVAALDEIVAGAAGEIGQLRFGALGIDEDVGLVGALVDSGAA
jgi:hypothetical protein